MSITRAAPCLFALSLAGCAASPPSTASSPAAPAPVSVAAEPDATAAMTAEAAPAADDPDRVPFGPDERAAELAYLRDALRDSYAHLETKRRQWGVELDAVFTRYEPQIRRADTWSRYELAMVGFVSEFHDAHLIWRRQRAPGETRRRIVRLGLSTRFIGATLVIDDVWPGSDAERAGLRVGDRIVAIDGQTIEQRLGALGSLRSWSRVEAARYDFAVEWPAGRAPIDAPPRARRLTLERDDGSYETLLVIPETEPRPGASPPHAELEQIDGVHVLRLRSFRVSRREIEREADELFAAIFADPRGLVIDLRGNRGGFEETALAVLARLADRPVTAGETRVRLSPRSRKAYRAWRRLAEDPARPGWSVAEPVRVEPRARRPFPRPVAVLIDAGCRSSCESAALVLRALGARLVGERTGGSSGAPITVELERSGSRVHMSARALFDPTGAPVEGRGVAPDETVTPTRADLVAGRDPALERAIRHVAPPARKPR